MKEIFAVMNTTCTVVKIRPKKIIQSVNNKSNVKAHRVKRNAVTGKGASGP